MRLKRLVVPGRYVEAYLYFDFLWLFSKDGTIRAFDIERYCNNRLNGDGAAASVLFADNRRGSDSQSHLMSNVRKLLDTPQAIEVSVADVDRFSYIFEDVMKFKSILDVRYYYGRAYVGTDAEIMQLEAHNRQDLHTRRAGVGSRGAIQAQKVADSPARSIRCRFGAVGAACGNSGGLIGFDATNTDSGWRIQFKAFAKKSFGVEINGYIVTNLSTHNTIEFFNAEVSDGTTVARRADVDETDESLRVAAVDHLEDQTTSRVNAILSRERSGNVFLFSRTLWQFDVTGLPSRLDTISKDRKINRDVTEKQVRARVEGRVLSMSSTACGVLAETDDEVLIFSERKWVSLLTEAVHSMRGYQSSKRYQQIMTAVARDRVEVMSIWRS